MSDLRRHLFATLEALQDDEKPMELARAKTISDVAQTIINSAKAETEFMEVVGATGTSEFYNGLDLEMETPARRGLDAPRPRTV
jgi:hypothetical protein